MATENIENINETQPNVSSEKEKELSTEELEQVSGGTGRLTSDPCEGGQFRSK
jgi:bacteriocin-like protein